MTTLYPGQSLRPGQSLKSNNGLHTLILQDDGNTVLYDRQSRPLWSTNTGGLIKPCDFIMQTDGNLVLYSTDGQPRWASNTWNNPGAFLNIQDDGNLVVYRAGSHCETAENALWAAASNDIWESSNGASQGSANPSSGGGPDVNQMLDLVNQQRSAFGLAPLSINPQLMAAAQAHSEDMANNNFMGHNGSDGSLPWDRAQRAGYGSSFVGENVAAGYETFDPVLQTYMDEQPPNDGHRRNVLNADYHEIGFGYAYNDGSQFKQYWTQDFGSR